MVTAYTTVTKNPWLQTDTVSYLQHHINQLPLEKVKTVIQTGLKGLTAGSTVSPTS
jgi:hypothetical protein